MIPKLQSLTPIQTLYAEYLDALRQAGFQGELNLDYSDRVTLSTDNSIYQRLPQAVIYPQDKADVARVCRLLGEPQFRKVVLAPRGGGTGTNGQSLTDGLVVDLSRHMNRILEFNAEERWIRVEAGVVKDQLNRYVESEGLFFAPELSTSNRATIGGMINTDASGQGSCRYGKTRDHVLELDSVLLGGECIRSFPMPRSDYLEACEADSREAQIYREARRLIEAHQDEIERRFPTLNRCLTGYDLAHAVDALDNFDLNSLLCGSEGTLAFITEAKLSLEPIPKVSALINIGYDSFQSALEDARALMATRPTSIETVDSTVLNLAREDVGWDQVAEFFPERARVIAGINLVEFTADDEGELERQIQVITEKLEREQGLRLGYTVAWGHEAVKRIWIMRKQAVGLLGNQEGDARPVPFVEDTAVPPENLPAFIAEFRCLLDSYGLHYGMFGHVDAGVLHVRPALDMKSEEQALLIRPITDAVVKLVAKYNGLLWGEHGKGVRSEYVPEVFGPLLYGCLQQIKAMFDPYNQLNPGKICTPLGTEGAILRIDEVGTRGELDRQIPTAVRKAFPSAMNCNGNGGCFNFDPDDAMCPSWKGTRQRIQQSGRRKPQAAPRHCRAVVTPPDA